eukprot:6198775-Pleurochrysis_carterae.AAC.2
MNRRASAEASSCAELQASLHSNTRRRKCTRDCTISNERTGGARALAAHVFGNVGVYASMSACRSCVHTPAHSGLHAHPR